MISAKSSANTSCAQTPFVPSANGTRKRIRLNINNSYLKTLHNIHEESVIA